MRHRHSLIDIFSTFAQFADDRFSGWITDLKLQRSIEMRQKKVEEAGSASSLPESFWVLYWYRLWQTHAHQIARDHLLAYLQESCYWAAYKTLTILATPHYKLSDFFQIGISEVPKILKGFSPEQGSSLKAYASATFSTAIRDILRQRQEADICSDWGLLRKLSQKRLVESLQSAGLPAPLIAQYVLAWTCFKTLYVPTQSTGTRQLARPNAATWDAIAHAYNSERDRLPHATTTCTAETLEQWLTYCASKARTYLYPTAISLNAPRAGIDDGELQDDLPDSGRDSLLETLVEQEDVYQRHTQQAQINQVLTNTLTQLDLQVQTLLQAYYGAGLTQQQMAQQLNIKQYTVSRRLTKAREVLLLALSKWGQQELHISPSSDVINRVNAVLEEWLHSYYRSSAAHSQKEPE
jgi:RNA polymerase sigma factor (sigma-70 family)